jgi:hypothetical protein
MAQIVNVRNYNPSTDIAYAKPKINSVGGKNVSIINSKVKKATYLSTPLMLTWGLSEFVDDKTGKRSYDLSLQFPNSEYPDPDGEMFLEKLKEFETKVKTDAVINSKEWFNKPKMTAEVVDALFTPMLKYPKNKDTQEHDYTRAPTLRVKVPYWENEWKVELYDMEQHQIWPSESDEVSSPVELIPKLTRIACVLQCGGIWLANGKFGVTWKLFQAVVKPPQSLKGKCHIRVSDSEKERMNQDADDSDYQPPDQTSTSGSGSVKESVGVTVQDSDDEEEKEIMRSEQTGSSPGVSTVTSESVEEESSNGKKKVVRRKKGE